MSALSKAATSRDGLATTREIASWVREAAGSELAQRRLAILDASRSEGSLIPPDVDRVRDNDASEVRNAEPTSGGVAPDINASAPPPSPATETSGEESNESAFEPEVVSRPMSSGPPSMDPASMADVRSLFYGREEAAVLAAVHSISSRNVESESGRPLVRPRVRHRPWLIAAVLIATLFGIYLATRSIRGTPSATVSQPTSPPGQ